MFEVIEDKQIIVSYDKINIIDYLMARLERDPRVNNYLSSIRLKLKGEHIVLQGEVDNIATKRAAVDTVTRIINKLGAWRFVDHLHVRTARNWENHELMETVMTALFLEPVFLDYTLLSRQNHRFKVVRNRGPGGRLLIVSVNRNCVRLSGQVAGLTHKRLAEVMMWWLEGVEFVDNLLRVMPPKWDSDEDITEAVRCVLEVDPRVHDDKLQVGTASGVVVLNGSIATEQEKNLALRDAWYVPGVADVLDRVHAWH